MANQPKRTLTGRTLMDQLSESGTVLLDTADTRLGDHTTLLFADPIQVITADSIHAVPDAIAAAEDLVKAGHWAAGFVAYEAGYAFESQFHSERVATPLIWIGIYDTPAQIKPEILGRSFSKLASPGYEISELRLDTTRAAYVRSAQRIRRYIEEGDVYQINFTFPFLFDFDGDPRAFYRDLRVAQPVPYGAFINTGTDAFLSLSPELFFDRRNGRIVTRPMKGTAPAGHNDLPDLDARVAAGLQADPKNRAENLMIVDLLRNDLSRCCKAGSVVVPDLFSVHRYPSVWQMTSTVEGMLRHDATYREIFASLFPCGSVTGAPKIRAMEIISDLEVDPRGIYCGAIGFMAPEEQATFSVAIRTIALKGSEGRMGTGSGIVWDSDANDEFDECLIKIEFIRRAAGMPS